MFWLEFISEIGIDFPTQEMNYLLNESNELTAIFTSIGKTTKQNINSINKK